MSSIHFKEFGGFGDQVSVMTKKLLTPSRFETDFCYRDFWWGLRCYILKSQKHFVHFALDIYLDFGQIFIRKVFKQVEQFCKFRKSLYRNAAFQTRKKQHSKYSELITYRLIKPYIVNNNTTLILYSVESIVQHYLGGKKSNDHDYKKLHYFSTRNVFMTLWGGFQKQVGTNVNKLGF